jgi:hypothetical protein
MMIGNRRQAIEWDPAKIFRRLCCFEMKGHLCFRFIVVVASEYFFFSFLNQFLQQILSQSHWPTCFVKKKK